MNELMKRLICELKDHLSKYLKRAADGEEIVITSHGKPVARLAPISPLSKDKESATIEWLRAQPWIRPGNGGKAVGLQKGVRLRGTGPSASEIVLENRGSGRALWAARLHSVHLAAADLVARQTDNFTFACYDNRLNSAARALGMDII